MIATPLFGALVDRIGRRLQLLFWVLRDASRCFRCWPFAPFSTDGMILFLCVSFRADSTAGALRPSGSAGYRLVSVSGRQPMPFDDRDSSAVFDSGDPGRAWCDE